MSKLSKPLKDLIFSPSARPGPVPAPRNVLQMFDSVAKDATRRGIGKPSWLTLSAATAFTLNSPESLLVLHKYAAENDEDVQTVEFIREVGLKCISFNGIPRVINCLNDFRDGLPEAIQSRLAQEATRRPTVANIESISARGEALWKSVYYPLDSKLVARLSNSHPDLPVVIINSHYGALLSDPDKRNGLASIGRVLTSLIGITCLRAQTGTGPQVLSHVYGLRKAYEDGTFKQGPKTQLQGADVLSTDAGGEWILNTVDRIVGELAGTSTFANTTSKL